MWALAEVLLAPKGCLGAIAQSKLTENPSHVVSDSTFCDVKRLGNFSIIFALSDESENVLFSLAQLVFMLFSG